MAKSRKNPPSARPARTGARAKPVARVRRPSAAATRSPKSRKRSVGGKAAPPPRSRPASERRDRESIARVSREADVPGTKARSDGLVERVPRPATPASRPERGRYVYCIIRANAPLKFGGIGMDEEWADVYTINYKDMAAVVSEVSMNPLDSTRENVLAHERVNETVMRDHTVIPMSFGTIFKTRDDIVELLRSAYEAFADVLNKMQDKLEFGLKVLWDRDEIVRAIEQEDEDIHRLKDEISSQKGSTYFARMQYGRLIDSALQGRSERYVSEFLQRLRDVSVASRVNRAIGDKMIMNAAFLVQRDQEQAFDRRIKEIASRFDKLTFKYTGPWPPYNFVNIRLKLERAGQH